MISPRSFLFIPGDSDSKLSKIEECAADAVILDLEDAVALPNKALARGKVVAALEARPPRSRSSQIWVRINSLDSGLALQDLAGVIAGAPDGVMLPKANGPEDVRTVSCYLDALEVAFGVTQESVRILPVATETASAPFKLGDYAQARLPRLAGLTWGAEDLAAAIGASTNLDARGDWALTFRIVRSMTLLAAHAAGVPAIETLYVDFRDDEGLLSTSQAARAEGFSGRIAIHPRQVTTINAAFSPTEAEIEHALKIVAAFEASGGAGTVGIDGKMFDIPHLRQAHNTLAAARREHA